MKIFPAIDIRSGSAVRLLRGDYDRTTVYSDSPVSVAEDFAAAGARYLHVVDLDGAKDGSLANFETVRNIISATGMFVEIGGGIRDAERIKRYLDCGAARVILGTAALENPEFLAAAVDGYGKQIAVGVDAKDGLVATRGWLEVSSTDSLEFCKTLRDAGVDTVIYTDISRDGAMQGTNLPVYRELSGLKGLNIVASGGISSLDELDELKITGTYGAILGRSLYTGAVDLRTALEKYGE